MYLQKPVQYHSEDVVKQDEKWNLYKATIVFITAFLKKSVPIVIHSLSEIKFTSGWLKSEINKCMFDLMKLGIKVITLIILQM